MKNKLFLFLFLGAAWVAFNAAPARAQVTPEKATKEKSVGGTQSERQQDAQTPLPPGQSQTEMKEGKMSREGAAGRAERKGTEGMEARGGSAGERWDTDRVKVAQEALKNKGHDPGPIDGVVGPKTREAIKQFQSASGLKETGRLDAETAQKLGIDKGAAPKESRETKEPAARGKAESSPMPKEPSPMGK